MTEEINTSGVQVEKVYTAKSLPKFIEKTEAPELRILGFSTICYSKEVSPKPDRNPVVIISVATKQGRRETIFSKKPKRQTSPASFHKLCSRL